jgi:hypothetical protein
MPDADKKVDEDWKKRAQSERESVKAAMDAAAEEVDAEGMPAADLLTLISSFVAQASIHLGLVEHPIHKEVRRDLRQARYAIDMLGVIEEKTRGNLTEEEKRFLETVLTDMRLRFVEETKAGR